MLVLAHVLRPKDFGLVSIAVTLILIIEAVLELPVSQALVRLEYVEPVQYDTAFTLNLLRGSLLGLVVCLLSWPFAQFYGDTRLLALVCVLGLAPAARGLVSPKIAEFSRNLDFSPDFTMEIVGKVAAFLTAASLAFITRSYWAIAAGIVMAPLASTITSYILAPYWPRLSLSALSAFSGFLGWITAAQVVSAFNWQTDRLLLGKLTSKADLGLFTAANDIATMPVMALLTPIHRPLLSAFSLVKEDAGRIAQSYQRSAAAMVTVGLPILVGESILATPSVRLLFGAQWLGSAPLLRWLAISLVPALFAMPLGPLVMSLGRTQVFFKRNLFEICIKLPLVIFGAYKYGFMGVIVARCISESATVLFATVVVRNMIGLSMRKQLLSPWRGIVSAAAMALVVRCAAPQLTSVDGTVALAAGLLLVTTLGAVTYCAVLWSLWLASGSPAGLEAMISEVLIDYCKRNHVIVASELS